MLDLKCNKYLLILINSLLWIWQILQVIPALVLLAYFRNVELVKHAGIKVYKVNTRHTFGTACFSLGIFIFCTQNCHPEFVKHEIGHSKQSIYYGIFYHFIVSIPSVFLFWIRRKRNLPMSWYHSKFPETQADELGEVNLSIYR